MIKVIEQNIAGVTIVTSQFQFYYDVNTYDQLARILADRLIYGVDYFEIHYINEEDK